MVKFLSKIGGNFLLRRKKIDYDIVFVKDNPTPKQVPEKHLLIVGEKDYPKWLYLKCPCGCGDILILSLMKKRKPNWNLKIDRSKRVTLYPSIWKKDGCRSHFWIRKGKLLWARTANNNPLFFAIVTVIFTVNGF